MSALPSRPAGTLTLVARSALRDPRALQRGRTRRVTILLGAILLLSLGDLALTLTHLTQAGMLEANPVARLVMAYNSPALLAAWTMLSVGLAVGILFYARRRALAEAAAWFCFLVLTWLTFRWAMYNQQISDLARYNAAFTSTVGVEWVAMRTDG